MHQTEGIVEPITWQSPWKAVIRAVKKAVRGNCRVTVLGRGYTLAYEARGHYEEDDYTYLAALAAGKRCVFDVGANVGLTSLAMLSSLDPAGKIVAFEAAESLCLILRENVLRNDLQSQIHVINAVVADSSGRVLRFNWDNESVFGSVVFNSLRGRQMPLNKASLAIDDFVRETESRPELIKLDIEGAEADALAGMRETLRTCRPAVFVEVHAWPHLTIFDNVGRLLAALRGTDYRFYHPITGKYVTSPAFFQGDSVSKISRTFALLLPEESTPPDVPFTHRDDGYARVMGAQG